MTKRIPNSDFTIDINGNLLNTKTGKYRTWVKHGRTKMLMSSIQVNDGCRTIHQHRIMAEYFIPNPENKRYIQHLNGDLLDNRIENLVWADNTARQKKAYKKAKSFAKNNLITYKPVIDTKTGKIYKSVSEAALKNKLSRTYLSNMLNGVVRNKTTLIIAKN